MSTFNRYANPVQHSTHGELYPVRKLAMQKRISSARPFRFYHVPAYVASRSVFVRDHWEKQSVRIPETVVSVSGTLHYSPAIFTADGTFTYPQNFTDYTDDPGYSPANTDLETVARVIVRAKLRRLCANGFTARFQQADLEDAISSVHLALIERGYRDGFSGNIDALKDAIFDDKDAVFACFRACDKVFRPRGNMSAEGKYRYYVARFTRERQAGKNTMTDAQIEAEAQKRATVPAETIPGSPAGIPCSYHVRMRDRLIASINAHCRKNPAFLPFRSCAVLSVTVGYMAKGTCAGDAVKIDGRKEPSLFRGVKRLVCASVASIAANNPGFASLVRLGDEAQKTLEK